MDAFQRPSRRGQFVAAWTGLVAVAVLVHTPAQAAGTHGASESIVKQSATWDVPDVSYESSVVMDRAPAGVLACGCDDSVATCADDTCCCDGACHCGSAHCGCGGVLGIRGFLDRCDLIQPTSSCYGNFISPMTNPVYFEDPRTLTEARIIFLNHKVPLAAGGGDVQLYAMQVRAALTDRLSFIATKDGYIVSQNALIDDGWADVSAGLKYNLYCDPCAQRILSAGAVYDLPVGTPDALQGNGNGTFNLFLSGGAELFCNSHWVSGTGVVLPADDTDESTLFFWSNHFDYYLGRCLYAVTEVNWYNYLESGAGGIAGVEGGDLFNFGSTGVTGNDIVTGAFGLKYRPSYRTEVGVAWEVPLTERRDVLENRITFDWILRY